MIFAAIDPGLHGAVAAIDGTGRIVYLADTPIIPTQVGRSKRDTYVVSEMVHCLEALLTHGAKNPIRLLVIENQRGMPGQGSPSVFSLGYGLGLWVALAAALVIPYEKVEPAKWKKSIGLSGVDKGASVIRAGQLFPQAELHTPRGRALDGRAEALLMAEWARRQLHVPQTAIRKKVVTK